MTAFNRFVVRHPWWVIAVFVASSAFFAAGLGKLEIDFDVDTVIPRHHPEVEYKYWMQEFFGVDEPAVLIVMNEGPHGVFTPETLGLVAHLSDELNSVRYVDGDDVVSLSEVDNITADEDALVVKPFFEDPPSTQEEADRIRDAVFANPMMVGTVVSVDGEATLVAVDTLQRIDKSALHLALEAIVTAAPHGSSRIEIAGRPIVESQMNFINRREMAQVMPLIVVVAAVALALSLHCVRGVLLPLLVVLTAVVWTMGLMGWLGRVFSALNSPMPMMLVPIGIADGIHVIHHYLHTVAVNPDRDNSESVFETMQEMMTAVVVTSLTTAAGLMSLATSSVETNRSFGYFAAFGTLAAMAFSLTVLPAILTLLPRPRRGVARLVDDADTDPGPMRRCADWLADLVTDRPRSVFAATAIVLVFGVAGLPLLTTDGSFLKNFPKDDPVRRADRILGERFGGSLPLEIVIDGGEVDAWKSPEKLRALQEFQASVEGMQGVGETRSIADIVLRMNAVMNPGDPAAGATIPDSQALIAQYLLLYSISGEPDDFDDVVDYDYAVANVRAQTDSDHSPALLRVLDGVREASDAHLGPVGLSAHPSGAAREIYEFVDMFVSSQISGLAVSLLLVWAMAALMLRSVVGGLLTTLPVGIATLATFAGLGWTGEPVGVTTAIMSAIAIGIGVDYAVHFVTRYREGIRRGLDVRVAMRTTLGSAGIAIFYNALVVIAGFLAMATSDFLPPRIMGLLVSWNMLVCFGATITTLAALLAWFEPSFLRAPARR
jgi:predicted RND superfamily exporter protein